MCEVPVKMQSGEPKIWAIQISHGLVEFRSGSELRKKVCRLKRKGRTVLSQTVYEGGKVLGYLKADDCFALWLQLDVAQEITLAQWGRLRRKKI